MGKIVAAPWLAVVALLSFAPAPTFGDDAPALAQPIACDVGRTCFIQHYVDLDPGPGARDFTCGPQTYEGHNGIDIRLTGMAAQRAGVSVLAAAPGVVAGVRDSMADVSVRVAGLASVKDVECGNGALIDHGGGWSTQYCHMAHGSLAVKAGDHVTTGQVLGRVGLSGETEFPHLHFTVRHNGQPIEPFAYGEPAGACSGGRSLITARPGSDLGYHYPEVINAGFASRAVTMDEIESGVAEASALAPGPRSTALAAYVRVIGLKAGDQPSLRLVAPDGAVLADNPSPALSQWQAQSFLLTGKRLTAGSWPAGAYRARFTVRHGGAVLLTRDFTLMMAAG